MKKVLALLLVLVLALSVFVACGEDTSKDNDKDSEIVSTAEATPDNTEATPNNTAVPVTPPTTAPSDSDYDKVFDGTGIVHFNTFFGMDTANFAQKDEDGTITCDDLGYKDGIVKTEVSTVYFPISDYTADEKTQLETAMKEAFSAYDELECCTVKYNMGSRYFSVSVEAKDMDKPENSAALYEAGILEAEGILNMAEYEAYLLSAGFVKK